MEEAQGVMFPTESLQVRMFFKVPGNEVIQDTESRISDSETKWLLWHNSSRKRKPFNNFNRKQAAMTLWESHNDDQK
jgi:hypothetical protein